MCTIIISLFARWCGKIIKFRLASKFWHVIKHFTAAMNDIAAGAKKTHGQKWHWQIHDKPDALKKHAYWAVKSSKSPEELQSKLLNAVDHFSAEHKNCASYSRCRSDPKYEPSHTIITERAAQEMFRDAIRKTALYKEANYYYKGLTSSFAETFNNVLNVYTDKRIFMSERCYSIGTYMAIIHWNFLKSMQQGGFDGFDAEDEEDDDLPDEPPADISVKKLRRDRGDFMPMYESLWEDIVSLLQTQQ